MIESSDITVIIPAYNRCPLLERSVDCLLKQTVLPGEIIVVHSGSDDPTSRLDDKSPIVRIIHRDERMRAGAARNIGSDFAKGKWFAFPGHAHHLRFAQPSALGRKISDEWTVPLCATHHRSLHSVGEEERWWKEKGIDTTAHAVRLWWETRHPRPQLAK